MYGSFQSGMRPGPLSDPMFGPALARSAPEIAIEILREFSPTELVGKVYAMGRGSNWAPVSQPGLRIYNWYQDFSKTKSLRFDMDGSDPWDVLYFRPESDDAGPYVAVGLRLAPRQ